MTDDIYVIPRLLLCFLNFRSDFLPKIRDFQIHIIISNSLFPSYPVATQRLSDNLILNKFSCGTIHLGIDGVESHCNKNKSRLFLTVFLFALSQLSMYSAQSLWRLFVYISYNGKTIKTHNIIHYSISLNRWFSFALQRKTDPLIFKQFSFVCFIRYIYHRNISSYN